jgi:hypothetical protein
MRDDISAKSRFPNIVINLSLKGFSFEVTETPIRSLVNVSHFWHKF